MKCLSNDFERKEKMPNRICLMLIVLCSVLGEIANAQSHDLNYFVNKWSRQQQDIAEKCVISWFSGATLAETSNLVVELIRVEALLSSTHTTDIKLLLPAVGQVSPQEVPGKLLEVMLKNRDLSITPDRFFINRQFTVQRINEIESAGIRFLEEDDINSTSRSEKSNDEK